MNANYLGHLPEHPLDTDSDLGHVLVVESSLCRGEVRSSEAAVDVTHDRIRGIAIDLALNAVPLLHHRKRYTKKNVRTPVFFF